MGRKSLDFPLGGTTLESLERSLARAPPTRRAHHISGALARRAPTRRSARTMSKRTSTALDVPMQLKHSPPELIQQAAIHLLLKSKNASEAAAVMRAHHHASSLDDLTAARDLAGRFGARLPEDADADVELSASCRNFMSRSPEALGLLVRHRFALPRPPFLMSASTALGIFMAWHGPGRATESPYDDDDMLCLGDECARFLASSAAKKPPEAEAGGDLDECASPSGSAASSSCLGDIVEPMLHEQLRQIGWSPRASALVFLGGRDCSSKRPLAGAIAEPLAAASALASAAERCLPQDTHAPLVELVSTFEGKWMASGGGGGEHAAGEGASDDDDDKVSHPRGVQPLTSALLARLGPDLLATRLLSPQAPQMDEPVHDDEEPSPPAAFPWPPSMAKEPEPAEDEEVPKVDEMGATPCGGARDEQALRLMISPLTVEMEPEAKRVKRMVKRACELEAEEA